MVTVELKERLVQRLKIVEQFQGAYYELVVANILIRAGFELTLEDETDGKTKHCEYAAVSKRTGKKYWVEAKMHSVAGLLGKTQRDGTTDMNPLNRLIPQLNDALAKPAADERLIFIDLNTEEIIDAAGKPPWIENAQPRTDWMKIRPHLAAHSAIWGRNKKRVFADTLAGWFLSRATSVMSSRRLYGRAALPHAGRGRANSSWIQKASPSRSREEIIDERVNLP
jgi:hypothetical protein